MREDDMDEMLRRAAENYEIDAGKAADWNFVYKAVHESEETAPGEKKDKRRRFIFWWLLLIPLGWLGHTAYNKFQVDGTSRQSMHQASVQTKTNKAAGGTQSSPEKGSAAKEEVIAKSSTGMDKNTSIKQSVNGQDMLQYKSHRKNAAKDYAYHYSSGIEPNVAPPSTEMYKPHEEMNLDTPVDRDVTGAPSLLNAAIKKDSATAAAVNDKDTINISDKAKKQAITIKPTDHYFYAGLVVGGDMSFVKYQKAQPIGYNIGLLAGYKFKKLSIESGLLFVKKNYYTDGEYFDKSKIPYFNDAEILTVDGYCRMFEIPLNIKYDFIEKKRHSFFATAGLSSYLMNKEYYNYDYIKDGLWHNGSRAYMHSDQNWFSILNLSAGYELRTGSKTRIRIEPYYKAPLNGVGTGSLPVSSIGVNAGITRQIP
ncbi:MAG TPA: hypothetical protein VFW07_10610 [Parafilimonas sp.]|nr:hypothetical protein [Parafilimonas sp.]